MDCECKKEKENSWPDITDETGEKILHEKTNKKSDLFDKIINRKEYYFSSEDEDEDLFLEDLIKPKKEKPEEDDFLNELKTDKHLLVQDNKEDYNVLKEKQIVNKLYKLL